MRSAGGGLISTFVDREMSTPPTLLMGVWCSLPFMGWMLFCNLTNDVGALKEIQNTRPMRS